MPTAIIALGGNQGDVAQAFACAAARFDAHGGCHVTARSSVYRTPAWGKTDQPDFLNAVLALHTDKSPQDVLDLCLAIEHEAGRDRGGERWGPRPLDLDVIVYDEVVCNTPTLTLPHPVAAERAFVLVPWAEMDPLARLHGVPVSQLLAGVDQAAIAKDADATQVFCDRA